MRELLIASHNTHKVQEFATLLAPHGVCVKSAADFNIPEPEETGATFAENADLKARHAATASGMTALSDDSGLVIPAIGGAPGIYSARWAGEKKDFTVAFARIQSELEKVGAAQNTAAYFICVLSLCAPDGAVVNFEGRVHGMLCLPPRGAEGFGYDPIFMPDGYSKTFAEMDAAIKNQISHRARALTKFLEYIAQHQ